MSHWAEAYLHYVHQVGVFDCASLVEKVQRERFGRVVELPVQRLSYEVIADQAQSASLIPTTAPAEGDLVLMWSNGREAHVGVYCLIGGVPHVLHTASRINTCIHQIAALGRGFLLNLHLDGYYRPTVGASDGQINTLPAAKSCAEVAQCPTRT